MNIWIIMIAVMIASAIVQAALNAKFNKYSKVGCRYTGAEVAEKMLRENGISDVRVVSTGGHLTDHYDPVRKTINLSEGVYGVNSIAAVAVAAHETGHAIQHATGYAPVKMRSALVPVVSFCNSAVSWILLLGCLLIQILPQVLWLGIAMFAMTTLF